MNEADFMPDACIHQFVFATWDLEEEKLSIVSEYEGTCTLNHRPPSKSAVNRGVLFYCKVNN